MRMNHVCVYVQEWPNVGHVSAKDKQMLFNVLVSSLWILEGKNVSLITWNDVMLAMRICVNFIRFLQL